MDGGSIEVDHSEEEEIEAKGPSSKLDSDFDPHILSPKEEKKGGKGKKDYTMEDLMKMVHVGNPKDVYSNLHEIGRGSYQYVIRFSS